jgi:hypothetical protein
LLKIATALRQYGAAILRDPRVTEKHNNDFLDLVEKYFEQPMEVKMQDVRKEYGYQVGSTPELVEEPKCKSDASCQEFIDQVSLTVCVSNTSLALKSRGSWLRKIDLSSLVVPIPSGDTFGSLENHQSKPDLRP